MKIHEYQAKEVLKRFGVPVLDSDVAFTADEAAEIAKTLGTPVVVVKAQIHAGGRGKGGGVKVVKDVSTVKDVARKILGMTLVTPQTGPEGKLVKKILVEAGTSVAKELYVAALVDRATGRCLLMACAEGGMEIEEVAARTPEKILKEYIHPAVGLAPYQARRMAIGLDMTKDEQKQAVKVFTSLVSCAIATDASMVEINPMVVTEQGQVLALDAKMNFDDNAMFRHKDLHEYRDLDEEAPEEVKAKNYDLNYIKLDGNIACMVNGAGLAMATMDTIKIHGGDPANFLDAGGSANEETVTEAFKIIINDPSVKSILVNIFGGIMKCDVIAQGVINAAKTLSLKVPLIVRLEGTNVDAGRKLLEESGLNIEFASGMDEAAGKAVAATKA